MRRTAGVLLAAICLIAPLAGCMGGSGEFDTGREIAVISREDGSGTRGAFVELLGIEQRGEGGTRKDLTTKEAIIAKQTDVMIGSIVGDRYAVGYISLGSLGGQVRALSIDGVHPTPESVQSGTYPIYRPFNIATSGKPTGLAADFIEFILSAEGQAVVAGSYIPVDGGAPAYSGDRPPGKIVVAGSSSVTPVMEKLKEAYLALNPGATIEIQMSDSSSGMMGVVEGTCDIGMASRELKPSEAERLSSTPIALDGIAIVVNTENPVTDLTKEQVRGIFTGEFIKWGEVIE